MIETECNLNRWQKGNIMSPLLLEFIRFALIGVLNTAVDLVSLNVMARLFSVYNGIGFALIKSCSFLVAVTCSYFLNKWWTFNDKSKEKQVRKICHFLLISMTGMVINVLAATLTVLFMKEPVNNLFPAFSLSDQLWINIGALSGSVAGLLWNFTGYKIFVFRTATSDSECSNLR